MRVRAEKEEGRFITEKKEIEARAGVSENARERERRRDKRDRERCARARRARRNGQRGARMGCKVVVVVVEEQAE